MKRLCLWLLLSLFTLTALSGCGGSHSKPPTEKDVADAFNAIYAKPAQPGLDGAVTVEIKSIKVGERRKWHYRDGGDATPDTDLWTTRVHLCIITHYRTRNMVFDWDKPYMFFRNGLGEWQLGSTTGGVQGDKTYDEPPDMK